MFELVLALLVFFVVCQTFDAFVAQDMLGLVTAIRTVYAFDVFICLA